MMEVQEPAAKDLDTDIESGTANEDHLTNINIQEIAWRDVRVEIGGGDSDARPKVILGNIIGNAEAGLQTCY